jgi:hypothetical protein
MRCIGEWASPLRRKSQGRERHELEEAQDGRRIDPRSTLQVKGAAPKSLFLSVLMAPVPVAVAPAPIVSAAPSTD